MNKIKKIIGVIVVTLFLSALIPNFSHIKTASANTKCPGWDGVTPFCGVTGNPQQWCDIVTYCTMVCGPGSCDE